MSRDNDELVQSKLDSDVEAQILRKDLAKATESARAEVETLSLKLAREIESKREREAALVELKGEVARLRLERANSVRDCEERVGHAERERQLRVDEARA